MKIYGMNPSLKVFLCFTRVLVSSALGFFISLTAQGNPDPKPTKHNPQKCEKALTLPGNPMAEFYGEKRSDVINLTDIYERHSKGEELSPEDLRFLYEIDGPIEGFGFLKPKRIEKIISQRDIKSDIALVLGIQPEQVSLTSEEALSGGIIYHYGDLVLNDLTSVQGLEDLTHIGGHAGFGSLKTAQGLEKLFHIRGEADFRSLKSPQGLGSLSHIVGAAGFGSLETAQGLGNLSHIGGEADFRSLESLQGLEKLFSIGGHAYLMSLKSKQGLENLTHIGGEVRLGSPRLP